MATTTLKKSKLAALKEHIESDGDNDLETVALLLGLEPDDEAGVKAYVDNLRETNPELFGGNPAAEPPPLAPAKLPSFQLLGENNLLVELEVVKTTPERIVLRTKVPRDLVVVKLGGKDVELDILELQRADQSEIRYGLAVSTLLTIARAAK